MHVIEGPDDLRLPTADYGVQPGLIDWAIIRTEAGFARTSVMDNLQLYSHRARWILTGFMVWLAFVATIVLASEQWKYHRGSKLLVPIFGGSELRIEVWPVVVLADRSSPYGYSMFSDEPTNARWVGIWYDDFLSGTTLRLAAFTLPPWPLLIMAATTVITAGWLWLLRVRQWPRTRRAGS